MRCHLRWVALAAAGIVAISAVACGSGGGSTATKTDATPTSGLPTSSQAHPQSEKIVQTQSDSMAPTIISGDSVAFRPITAAPSQGDIVAYYGRPPASPNDPFLIHRVIGLPGEKVEAREGALRVNDRVLAEPYLQAGTKIHDFPATLLPPDTYWIMGDNRDHAADSRVYGPIPKASIVAVATRIDQPSGRRRQLP